jgi:chromosome segregation ATPase
MWRCGRNVMMLVGLIAVQAAANPELDQLKKLHADTLEQLRIAQDRKNELANEVQQLRDQIAELARNAKRLENADVESLRAVNDAWRWFMRSHPALQERFDTFVRRNYQKPLAPPPAMFDPNWPFSAVGEVKP